MVACEKASIIGRSRLADLVDVLRQRGYSVIGPTLRDGAITYEEIQSAEELPAGWTDEQQAGSYRLRKLAGNAYFEYNVGPASWKRYLYPPRERLWQAKRTSKGIEFTVEPEPSRRMAFLGVRSCELHAIRILDRALNGALSKEPVLVAVNCTKAGGTCFCSSMKTGPRAISGFDLALTELAEEMVVETGSARGAEILSGVPHQPATRKHLEEAQAATDRAATQMGLRLDMDGVKELLHGNREHPRWEEVAQRCLTCANCTMVCPTCFCTTVEDTTDLRGVNAERWLRWDSCFTYEFSYIHGGSIRPSVKARYRQWMTHKLASWQDQFGEPGCVGCGRCITWCPAGIDITEEVRAIRGAASDPPRKD